MRKIHLLVILFLPLGVWAQQLSTRFERSGGRETGSYPEVIEWWKQLASSSPQVDILEMGESDAGYPMHLVLVSATEKFDLAAHKAAGGVVFLINNGIHPGEPEGIDATMLMVRDIVQGKQALPAHVILGIIPVYNIGGALNRSENYRIDQNGPLLKGFRGNGQNLDLNRDFIKADSKNAFAFARIFHYLDPDVFVDNHASNGADYQHIITLLTSQHNKLGGEMGAYLHDEFDPALRHKMKKMGYDLIPYVNHFGSAPQNGWKAFWDGPRYSSGYATLWSTFAFVPETHMLKPYTQRVEATRALMECILDFAANNAQKITSLRKETRLREAAAPDFPLAWAHDPGRHDSILFKGYRATRKQSGVSGLPRLYYDRHQPYENWVPYYNSYRDTLRVKKPRAYVIPRGWWKVIDRLRVNGVDMLALPSDTVMLVEVYRIESYTSAPEPFESHHVNYGVTVSKTVDSLRFNAGDWYIPLNQKANRFLIETLEPHAEDSYFAWNFFDAILGIKEWYSDYHFEDVAAKYLVKQPQVRRALEVKKVTDSAFANNAGAQLAWVFEHSPYFEPAYRRYPVYRVP